MLSLLNGVDASTIVSVPEHEEPPLDPQPHPPSPPGAVQDHHCPVCGEYASFGFDTRTGTVWTCISHRADGERHLVAAVRPARSGGGSDR